MSDDNKTPDDEFARALTDVFVAHYRQAPDFAASIEAMFADGPLSLYFPALSIVTTKRRGFVIEPGVIVRVSVTAERASNPTERNES